MPSVKRTRDLWIATDSIIYDLADQIAEYGAKQTVPVIMAFDEGLNFGMVCVSAMHSLRNHIEADTFDVSYIREYVLTYYGERGEVNRRALYIVPEMEADLVVVDAYMRDHYKGEIDQWVIKGDLFAHRGGKINLSFMVPLSIMWLHRQIPLQALIKTTSLAETGSSNPPLR